ncbi:hypothetical protein [Allobranchiibius sp. CTAmp26]|uniref:hypothetical protein n=1 Tax=Allobranchiibius sp. CTAmp26 TaxID=2815214 RepID=UPI001AA0FD8C|nr:hypothetical protein [Allobranchiibius sp. CTAmp26]MBO1756557.1 hypothetical protein [Allobranchiibius sp. CTAmp26]
MGKITGWRPQRPARVRLVLPRSRPAAMRLPVRPIRGRWPSGLERRLARFFWMDPSVVCADDTTPEVFRAAMSCFWLGGTFKITGAARHPNADELLIDHLDLTGADILEIGASDGSTSLDLIAKLPTFASYVVADLYLELVTVHALGHTFFLDQDGQCVLVVGRRLIGWPTMSKTVGVLYAPAIAAMQRTRAGAGTPVLLLNPQLRELMAHDGRVTHRVHDVFQPWAGSPPDLIKVANLLRRLYFPDAMISRALQILLGNLPEGGHLLIVDNARIKGIGPRAGLYRRAEGRLTTVAETPDAPEISDLIRAVGQEPDLALGEAMGSSVQADVSAGTRRR